MTALRDKSNIVREAAAQSLGMIADSRAVEALKLALADEESGVRQAAASALEKIKAAQAPPEAVPHVGNAQTTHLNHPTLPLTIKVVVRDPGGGLCGYELTILDKKTEQRLYHDAGQVPCLFKKFSDLNFQYDLNFDGHKELFVNVNNPAHADDCAVYIFDSGRVVKVRLEFSEILLDRKHKTFTCSVTTTQTEPPDRTTYQYRNGQLREIPNQETGADRKSEK